MCNIWDNRCTTMRKYSIFFKRTDLEMFIHIISLYLNKADFLITEYCPNSYDKGGFSSS